MICEAWLRIETETGQRVFLRCVNGFHLDGSAHSVRFEGGQTLYWGESGDWGQS